MKLFDKKNQRVFIENMIVNEELLAETSLREGTYITDESMFFGFHLSGINPSRDALGKMLTGYLKEIKDLKEGISVEVRDTKSNKKLHEGYYTVTSVEVITISDEDGHQFQHCYVSMSKWDSEAYKARVEEYKKQKALSNRLL